MYRASLQWLYCQYHGEHTAISGPAHCYLCAASCPQEHLVSRAIADTFNSHYLTQAPSSAWLCAACAWYLDNKAGHPEFRKMSLVVERDAWRNWARPAMKGDLTRWLQDGLRDDAYLVVSLTKKKHILLQAPMNAGGSRHLAVQVEEQVAHIDEVRWRSIDEPFMALLALGHGKGEILSGNLYGSTLRKHGHIAEALSLSQQLERWRSSPCIDLLSYVTIVDKEDQENARI